MSYKRLCKIFKDVTPNKAMEIMFYEGERNAESKVICYGCLASLMLGFALLCLVSINGIYLYRAIEVPLGLPDYSNFVVGMMYYTLYVILRKCFAERNFYELLCHKITAFFSMSVVFLYFISH